MKKLDGRGIWGILLILLGVLFLLQELQIVGNAFQFLWMAILFGAAILFLWTYFRNDKQWWAVIPGLALLGLTFASLEDALNLFPGVEWGGLVFLASIGVAFWMVYIRRTEHWWAIIPGGVLLTLAVVAGLDQIGLDGEAGIFFIGLGLTFAMVALLPAADVDTRWSWIPALVLLVLGATQIFSIGSEFFDYWPLVLILIGGYILYQGWQS